MEAGGGLTGADPDRVSDRAYTRGRDQCGTLGSGNHFLEVQVVDRMLDEAAAQVMGLRRGASDRADSLGVARAGVSGVRGSPGGVRGCAEAVWVHAAGQPARLCADSESGGTGLPGRDAGGGELCVLQPTATGAPGA